ncbi:MAG: DUF2791 family P-loop domain-containing protein [Thermoplasmata archaeon]
MEIPFVGRDKEIQELKQGLESARNGRGKMYFITGPVGIGKTRLILEISKYAEKEGFTVLFGRCLDEKAVPYLPITDVLEKYSKREADDSYTPLALVGGASAEIVEETSVSVAREKTRVLENYLRKFTEISQKAPILFILDDVQWADSGTLSFLHYLSRAISDMRILAIAAYPDEYLKVMGNTPFTETIHNINIERNCMGIVLSPLGVNDVSIILGAILGTWKLPKELVEEVHERTGGNPLFVEEVGRAIQEQDLFDVTKRKLKVDISEIQLPGTVKTIISQRVSRFDEDTKKVLRGCAILGRIFEYEALKNTVEMDEDKLLDILDKLIATGYLEQAHAKEEVYKFVHNPVYEVIYMETSAPRRRLMHKKAGTELEKLHGKDKKYYAEIGRHFILGGEPQKGVQYKILAAEFAMANYATEETLQNLLEAVGVLENIPDENVKKDFVVKIHRMLGDCYSTLAEFDKAISSYEKALQNTEEVKTRIGLLIKMSYPYMEKGDFSKCIEILENALSLAGEDAKLKSEIYRNRGWVHEKKGEYMVAVDFYKKAAELSEQAGDEILVGEAYHRLGTGLWFLGDLKRAKEYIEKGLEIRKKHNLKKGIAGSYNNLGIIYGDMGEVEKSLEFYDKAKRMYEEIGDLSGVSTIYNNVAGIYTLKGEDEEAIEFYKKDLEISKRIGDRTSEMLATSNIGTIYQDREDYKTALEYYETAIKISRELGEKRMYASTLNSMATTYAEMGNLEKAMELIKEAKAIADETGSKELIAGVISGFGEIYRLSKKFEEAEREYMEAMKLYQEIEKIDSFYSTKVDLARVYIDSGRNEEAIKLLEEAKQFYTKVGGKGVLKKIEKEYARIEKGNVQG